MVPVHRESPSVVSHCISTQIPPVMKIWPESSVAVGMKDISDNVSTNGLEYQQVKLMSIPNFIFEYFVIQLVVFYKEVI